MFNNRTLILYTGILAGILTTAAAIPQVYDIYETGNTKGLDVKMVVMYLLGQILWCIYGYSLKLPSVFVFAFIAFFLWLYMGYKMYLNLKK
tara:strand:+ start:14 stop:286 length:273 start_codon:yes stop_codon:yes gene_type:complete